MFKVIFTVLVVYVVWFSFKNWARIQSAYKEVQDEKARGAGASVKEIGRASCRERV